MEFTTFVRKPFEVQALQITKENIEELAPMIGDLEYKEDGSPYIQVDKEKVRNMFRVYPGDWLTKMGGNVRCYARKVFSDQFVEKAR